MLTALSVLIWVLLLAGLGMLIYAKVIRMKLAWRSLLSARGTFGEWISSRMSRNLNDPLERSVYQESRLWMLRGYLLIAFVVVAGFILAWVNLILGH